MILPNGCFCLIREIISSLDRGLVLVVDYWDDQAAHDRGESPHSSHDHGFGAFKEPARDEQGQPVEHPDYRGHVVMAKRRCQESDDVRVRVLVAPEAVASMRGCADVFDNLMLRSATSVSVQPTGGMFGAMTTNAAKAATFTNFGPYSDPALYAVPATSKVVMG